MVAAPQYDARTFTPFADAALDLLDVGLAPIPLGGDDGKVPLVKWASWRYCPSVSTVVKWVQTFPTANVGMVTGLSNIIVVDIDDIDLIDRVVERFGETPIQIVTPSGGLHLYYRSQGEKNRNLRHSDGIDVDIRGIGGMVVVPPSVRPSGPFAGQNYRFWSGSWGDLNRLPTINPSAWNEEPVVAHHLENVSEGRRDEALFLALMDQAPACDNFDALLDVARTVNDGYLPPLPDKQVVAKARAAWKYETEDRNFRGHRGHGAQIVVAQRVFMRLLEEHPKQGPDAHALWLVLRANHGARDRRGETFAIAARAMAHKVLLWSEKRIRKSTEVLVDFGLLEIAHEGGSGKGDANQYRFSSPPPVLVPELGTNVIRHPSPLSSPPQVGKVCKV